jgi:D-glycero-beta-D-manno-heptose-7-phosphate kinase
MAEYVEYKGFGQERLDEILSGIRQVKVALIGDAALDIYWRINMTFSELSRETPHYNWPVVAEQMSPGAAGNVAANICELMPGRLDLIGVTGEDWRGDCLRKELTRRGIGTGYLFADPRRMTTAYCKPMKKGFSDVEAEDARIDFDNRTPLAEDLETRLIEALDCVSAEAGVLCVSDQFKFGCITPRVRAEILRLAKRGLMVVVDSRDRIRSFAGAILKPNDMECLRAVYPDRDLASSSLAERISGAAKLSEICGSRVCMTIGSMGCVVCGQPDPAIYVPSVKTEPPVDIVGAGDSFLSAFACALAAGADSREAAFIANLAASVTIRKIGTTGTASLEEIRCKFSS